MSMVRLENAKNIAKGNTDVWMAFYNIVSRSNISKVMACFSISRNKTEFYRNILDRTFAFYCFCWKIDYQSTFCTSRKLFDNLKEIKNYFNGSRNILFLCVDVKWKTFIVWEKLTDERLEISIFKCRCRCRLKG